MYTYVNNVYISEQIYYSNICTTNNTIFTLSQTLCSSNMINIHHKFSTSVHLKLIVTLQGTFVFSRMLIGQLQVST